MNDSRTKPTVYPPAEPSPELPEARGGDPQACGRGEARSRGRSTGGASEGAPEFVFYDGPPFANGLPHYGHIVTGFVKDLVPRYQTMRGKMVERRFGWDCHGLPAELHSEKRAEALRPPRHPQVRRRALQRALPHVGDAVPQATGNTTSTARRAGSTSTTTTGRWTSPTWRATMWAFKQLWDKGLVYEGFRVVPYSWAAQTPLSQFRDAARQFLPHAPGPGADRRLQARSGARRDDRAEAARVDDDAVDAAVQHGARGQAGRRLRA